MTESSMFNVLFIWFSIPPVWLYVKAKFSVLHS